MMPSDKKEGTLARLRDIGNVWKTIKEIDVQGIRDEAEQALRITLIGPAEVRSTIARLLRSGSDRYPPAGADPLEELAVPLARQRQGGLSQAELLIQVMAADKPLSTEEHLTYEK